eukprot:6721000-Prymnesium_polylepis.1
MSRCFWMGFVRKRSLQSCSANSPSCVRAKANDAARLAWAGARRMGRASANGWEPNHQPKKIRKTLQAI